MPETQADWRTLPAGPELEARLALADKLAEAVEIYFDNRPSGADCSIPVYRRKNAQSALAAYLASAEVAP